MQEKFLSEVGKTNLDFVMPTDSDNSTKTHGTGRWNGFALVLILSAGTMLLRETTSNWFSKKAIDAPPLFQSEINVAPLQELQLLPKIGKTMAESLINFRTENGPIRSAEDLKQIRGIGESRSQDLQSSLSFNEKAKPPTTR